MSTKTALAWEFSQCCPVPCRCGQRTEAELSSLSCLRLCSGSQRGCEIFCEAAAGNVQVFTSLLVRKQRVLLEWSRTEKLRDLCSAKLFLPSPLPIHFIEIALPLTSSRPKRIFHLPSPLLTGSLCSTRMEDVGKPQPGSHISSLFDCHHPGSQRVLFFPTASYPRVSTTCQKCITMGFMCRALQGPPN